MPDFLVGSGQTYTSGQAVMNALVALGDLTGLGDHNVIVDHAFDIGDVNPLGLQAAADGRVIFQSSGLFVMQLDNTVNRTGHLTFKNFIGSGKAGFTGTELFGDNNSIGNHLESFSLVNPNGLNIHAVQGSANFRDNKATIGSVNGFSGGFKAGIIALGNVERVTAANGFRGIRSCANVIDCASVNNSESDFSGNTNLSYCASSDLTATGVGSITGINPAIEFVDATNGDFTLANGSQLIAAGSSGNNIGSYQIQVNQPPGINDQSFTALDNVQNGDVIDTVVATDPESAIAGFEITGTALAINAAGELTVSDATQFIADTDIVETVTVFDDEPIVHFIHGMTNASYLNLDLIDNTDLAGFRGTLAITMLLDDNLGATAELNVTYSDSSEGGDTTYFIPNVESEDSGNGIGISATPGTNLGNGKVRYVFNLDLSSLLADLDHIDFYHNYSRYDITVENVEAVGFTPDVGFNKTVWGASATNGSSFVWGAYDTATITVSVDDATSFSVTGESTTTPKTKSQMTFAIANASGPISVSSSDGSWDVVSQSADQLVVDVLNLDAEGITALFNSDIVVSFTDNGVARTRTIQIAPEDGSEFGVITDPDPLGDYKNTSVVAGNHVYRTVLSGDPVGDIGTGLYDVTMASTVRIRIHDGSAWGAAGIATYEAPLQVANEPPTANNQTFSIAENAANGSQVGQFVATDSDGSIDGNGYSVSGGVFAISNSGMLLLADNSSLVAGTPIVATVSFMDDDGDIGTATVTVNVTAVQSVTNPGLRFEIRDAESGNALILNETGLHIVVYDSLGGVEIFETVSATSSSAGVVVLDSDLFGSVGASVFIVAVRGNGQTVCGNETVIDLDA